MWLSIWRGWRLPRFKASRRRRRITDCLDNLFDCVDHQLRFLGLNVVRALGRDFVLGLWCNRRQRVLRSVRTPYRALQENRLAMAATG